MEKMTGDILIIRLPPGICQGAIEGFPEKFMSNKLIGLSYTMNSAFDKSKEIWKKRQARRRK